MNRSTSRKFALASALIVMMVFLSWWWWPRSEEIEPVTGQPFPGAVVPKGTMPRNAVKGNFEEVKLPDGEVGYLPRLTSEQASQLKKGGVVTITGPNGGVLTVGGAEVKSEGKSK